MLLAFSMTWLDSILIWIVHRMNTVFRRFALVIGFLAMLLGVGTFVPRPLFAPVLNVGDGQRILLVSSAIHTDIAIPLDKVTRRQFSFLEQEGLPLSSPNARWIVFGWGGRSFYTETPSWSELKPAPVFKALTIDRSVMHVELAGDIPLSHSSVTVLNVGPTGLTRLKGFILASFEQDTSGNPIILQNAGYGLNDRFYEARGWFNALVGCNTWTAEALRVAGLRTGLWNPLPVTLRLSLSLFNPPAR